jgi:RimJ/RimL family protein N-acetyltransferase
MINYRLKDGRTLGIRWVEERDAEEIVDMSVAMGGESDNLTFGSDDFYFTIDQQRIFISNIRHREGCLYVAALCDGKIAGTLSFIASPRRRVMHRGEMGIGILKDYWGIGIGSCLMEYFLKWAKSDETIKKVDLQVREDNTRAINLYIKYGFKIEGRISLGMCVDDEYYDLYCMGKIIG